jgi:hypothetical protein
VHGRCSNDLEPKPSSPENGESNGPKVVWLDVEMIVTEDQEVSQTGHLKCQQGANAEQ